MKRILFCDDEVKITDGLRRMLRRQRKEWDMVFVNSGREALEAMAKQHFDVLVTDMRMPGMDGAELMLKVQAMYPGTVRIVLSGYSEVEAALRAVPVAHQFLTKPCDPEVLKSIVQRACALHALLEDSKLQGILGGIDSLPSLPKHYHMLTKALADPEVDVEELASIVEQDAGISLKILQLVNSSFFALSQTISDISQAISYLGTNMLRNLVLGVEVFRGFKECDPKVAEAISKEQQHALLVSRIAQKIMQRMDKDRTLSEHAFIAGMMHDIGRMIMAIHLPEQFNETNRLVEKEGGWVFPYEEKIMGVTHAEVGAYLLGLWGMPYPVVEAVANHHHPSRVSARRFDALAAVHLADSLAYGIEGSDVEVIKATLLDGPFLAGFGIEEGYETFLEDALSVHETMSAGTV